MNIENLQGVIQAYCCGQAFLPQVLQKCLTTTECISCVMHSRNMIGRKTK